MKRILCQQLDCDFDGHYQHVYAYVQESSSSFMRRLLHDKTPDKDVPWETWTLLLDAMPSSLCDEARHRCIQSVQEAACVCYDGRPGQVFNLVESSRHGSMMEALAHFSLPQNELLTYDWIGECVKNDQRLLNQQIFRVMSGSLGHKTGTAFKMSLMYTHLIKTADEHVFMDSITLPMRTLVALRRAYEHVLFGRFHIDDITSKEAPMSALCHAKDPYLHSYFSYSLGNKNGDEKSSNPFRGLSNRQLLILSDNPLTPNLVLVAPQNKPFPYNHYRGCLELLSTGAYDHAKPSVVYVDARLNQHLLDRFALETNFVSDVPFMTPKFFPASETLQTKSSNEIHRFFLTRFVELQKTTLLPAVPHDHHHCRRGPHHRAELQGKEEEQRVCEKERLIEQIIHSDCARTSDRSISGGGAEVDNINARCYVQSFLLWQIIENPSS